ncbi:unnamed protein product, partial [Urochloa humidicola]
RLSPSQPIQIQLDLCNGSPRVQAVRFFFPWSWSLEVVNHRVHGCRGGASSIGRRWHHLQAAAAYDRCIVQLGRSAELSSQAGRHAWRVALWDARARGQPTELPCMVDGSTAGGRTSAHPNMFIRSQGEQGA